MASRNKQNSVHLTSTFTPVRSVDSSFRDCVVRRVARLGDKSRIGYPKVLLATDFYDGRFVNFWAIRNYDERILGELILDFSVCLSV